MKRLAVYCGSSMGSDPAFAEATRALGMEMARLDIGLVYGGGRLGLMGIIADSVLEAGGEAYGVIPQALIDLEVAHTGLTELHIVTTMHERKALMEAHADAFVALPGGIGTMDELFEIWTWRQLGYHDKPVGVLNVDGYYDALLAFLQATGREGFVPAAQLELLQVAGEPDALLSRLDALAADATAPDDYQSI